MSLSRDQRVGALTLAILWVAVSGVGGFMNWSQHRDACVEGAGACNREGALSAFAFGAGAFGGAALLCCAGGVGIVLLMRSLRGR